MGHMLMAWLTVIPDLAPKCLAIWDTCHSRRLSSGERTAVGVWGGGESSLRCSSHLSAKRGIQAQMARLLERVGVSVFTRTYPSHRKGSRNNSMLL